MNLVPQIPEGNQEAVNNFWQSLVNVGKEVLAEGQRIGYGFSLLEVKYAQGTPSIIIRSHTENRKYKSSVPAIADITDILTKTKAPGSQTFTVVREANGEISMVKLDEYLNDRLQ